MKRILSTLLGLLLFTTLSGQDSVNNKVEELRIQYIITLPKKELKNREKAEKFWNDLFDKEKNKYGDNPPPPPILEPKGKLRKYRSDHSCLKTSDIPPSKIRQLYPFDADSIKIAIHDDYFWSNRKVEIIGKLTFIQIDSICDLLYNYEYKQPHGCNISMSMASSSDARIPNLRILFYHQNIENYVDIFAKQQDIPERIRFVDSFGKEDLYTQIDLDKLYDTSDFGTIYWGGECSDTFNRLRRFIEFNFNCLIPTDRYEYNYFDRPVFKGNAPKFKEMRETHDLIHLHEPLNFGENKN